jgi:hypothetical protein
MLPSLPLDYGFHLNEPRRYPPIEVDAREWARRTQTRTYIQRIARSVRQINAYLWTVRGRARGVSGHQLDALHYLADTAGSDERRARRSNS